MRGNPSELERAGAIATDDDPSLPGIARGLGAVLTLAAGVGILVYRRSRALGPPPRPQPWTARTRRSPLGDGQACRSGLSSQFGVSSGSPCSCRTTRIPRMSASGTRQNHWRLRVTSWRSLHRSFRQPFRECVNGVEVRRFPAIQAGRPSLTTLIAGHVVAIVALHVAGLRALFRGATVLIFTTRPTCCSWLVRCSGWLVGAWYSTIMTSVLSWWPSGSSLRTSCGSPARANGLRLRLRATCWPRTTLTQTLQPAAVGRRIATLRSYVTGRPQAGYVCPCPIVLDGYPRFALPILARSPTRMESMGWPHPRPPAGSQPFDPGEPDHHRRW